MAEPRQRELSVWEKLQNLAPVQAFDQWTGQLGNDFRRVGQNFSDYGLVGGAGKTILEPLAAGARGDATILKDKARSLAHFLGGQKGGEMMGLAPYYPSGDPSNPLDIQKGLHQGPSFAPGKYLPEPKPDGPAAALGKMDRARSPGGLALGPALSLGRVEFEAQDAPDFSKAFAALGTGPDEPEPLSKEEMWARVLGGAASGALRGGGGQPGGTVASVLAGAGGGAAEKLTAARDTERKRSDRWDVMMQEHNARKASLEARAATADSETERWNVASELQFHMANLNAKRSEFMANRPEVKIDQYGMAQIRSIDEDNVVRLHIEEIYPGLREEAQRNSSDDGGMVVDFISGDWISTKGMPEYIAMPMRWATKQLVQGEIRNQPPDQRLLLDDYIEQHSAGKYDSVDNMLAAHAFGNRKENQAEAMKYYFDWFTSQMGASGMPGLGR